MESKNTEYSNLVENVLSVSNATGSNEMSQNSIINESDGGFLIQNKNNESIAINTVNSLEESGELLDNLKHLKGEMFLKEFLGKYEHIVDINSLRNKQYRL